MQCHEPGHRARARCVSALLAVGALLAAAADYVGGASERPAVHTAALNIPSALNAASISALLPGVRTIEHAGQPFPAMADPDPAPAPHPASAARHVQPTKTVRKATKTATTTKTTKSTKKTKATKATKSTKKTKTPARHKSTSKRPSKSRSTSRSRPAPVRHTNAYLLAHLPPAKNKKAAAAVHEALSLIGVPYRWGGTTRSGFDCSGFTQHDWGVAGVKIPRTVRAQAKAGTRISLSKAEPGDLVVFYPTQHHVGIYVGNGLVIDSPHTGARVRFDPVRSMPVSAVVRVKA